LEIAMNETRVVTEEQLRRLIGPDPEPEVRARSNGARFHRSDFDLGAWIEAHLPGARGPKGWSSGPRLWTLPECPFNPEHSRGEVFVGERSEGPIVAGCRHESCTWSWRELRERYEPGAYDREPRQANGAAAPHPNAPGSAEEPPPQGAAAAVTDPWLDGRAMVEEILARAGEPFVPLCLGQAEIARVRRGEVVTISAPTGAGKSSFTAEVARSHTHHREGWAFIVSPELGGDVFGARWIGQVVGASWADVLTGLVPREAMLEALPDRLQVIAHDGASFGALERKLEELRREDPGAEVLVVSDYGQIMPSETEDQRVRVSEIWARAADIARRYRVVVLMVSQMSRATSRGARAGERLGAQAIDGGAESAAIERWSSLVLEIGAASPPDEHGGSEVQLSIAKSRMGGGDMVIPLRYTGRTGQWTVTGEARPAAEVRAEVETERNGAKVNAAGLAMVAAAEKAEAPVTREALRAAAAVGRTVAKAAIDNLVSDGALVEVRQKKPHAKAWELWTREKAEAAGVPIVEDGGRND
jgi:hypothetical protein